jgi:hypothetical protein
MTDHTQRIEEAAARRAALLEEAEALRREGGDVLVRALRPAMAAGVSAVDAARAADISPGMLFRLKRRHGESDGCAR